MQGSEPQSRNSIDLSSLRVTKRPKGSWTMQHPWKSFIGFTQENFYRSILDHRIVQAILKRDAFCFS